MSNMLRNLLYLVVLVLGVALAVIGQRLVGPAGLGLMLVGLAGLLALLYAYNRRYQ